ncbi:hypothetical protein PTTG_26861 [Puccinia triticina 1-1 BBBD Race 1]|uniref:Uncharacterized protein n=1 Tax=Puccinia triticina (isolate 1-1 / race 1 (BBBD)) TaxID=630390 RepID=A0A180GQR6_PUCT1|nr:hypothetical protein PTTG_26861 [Puccinia triticina 1-1 BBBD Race 1]
MSNTTTASGNRPLTCQALFEIEEETQVLVPNKQQYGLISTPALFSCKKDNPMCYEVALRTNTSRDHMLIKCWIYKVTAKALFLNEKSKVPVLNYFPERAVKVTLTENFAGDTVDDATLFGVGLVVLFWKESKDDNPRHGPCLTAVVLHSDWDPNVTLSISSGSQLLLTRCAQDCVVKTFNVASIPRLIKTHTMFREGKEFFFDSILVEWEMIEKMAVLESDRRDLDLEAPRALPLAVPIESAKFEPVALTSSVTSTGNQAKGSLKIPFRPSSAVEAGDTSETEVPLNSIAAGKKRVRKF